MLQIVRNKTDRMIFQQAYCFVCNKQWSDAKYNIIIYSSETIDFHLGPGKCSFRHNHMEGKITEMWLANEEGIFS